VDEVKRYYRLDSDEDTKQAAPEQQEDLVEEIQKTKIEKSVSGSSSSEELSSEVDEAEERWARIRYVWN
jgi:predicted methyltransferase MtxX (methanogen marker protein 4)